MIGLTSYHGRTARPRSVRRDFRNLGEMLGAPHTHAEQNHLFVMSIAHLSPGQRGGWCRRPWGSFWGDARRTRRSRGRCRVRPCPCPFRTWLTRSTRCNGVSATPLPWSSWSIRQSASALSTSTARTASLSWVARRPAPPRTAAPHLPRRARLHRRHSDPSMDTGAGLVTFV